MKNMIKLVDTIYSTLASIVESGTPFKASSLGTIGSDTIIVKIGKDLFEVKIRKLETKEG